MKRAGKKMGRWEKQKHLEKYNFRNIFKTLCKRLKQIKPKAFGCLLCVHESFTRSRINVILNGNDSECTQSQTCTYICIIVTYAVFRRFYLVKKNSFSKTMIK